MKADGIKSYRPLCILKGKLFEQIINKRLIEEINNKGGLARTQYGFTKGQSTIDAIKKVLTTAENINRQTNNFAVLVTLDVKNAFNSAPWSGIVKEVKRKGI